MLVVALAALVSTGWAWARKSNECRKSAAVCAKRAVAFELLAASVEDSHKSERFFFEIEKRRLGLYRKVVGGSKIRDDMNAKWERELAKRELPLEKADLEVTSLRKRAAIERANATTFTRAARYPWLAVPPEHHERK
jgi:hypothetical protein